MQEAAFETFEVKPDDLGNAILGVRAFGMQGVNLTIPHKVSVIQYLDETAPDAGIIGAVNTWQRVPVRRAHRRRRGSERQAHWC